MAVRNEKEYNETLLIPLLQTFWPDGIHGDATKRTVLSALTIDHVLGEIKPTTYILGRIAKATALKEAYPEYLHSQ